MVYGVTQIDLPNCDWDAAAHAGNVHQAPPCFVAGPENRLAVPILRRLLSSANLPSVGFAPLVLTGPTGTGKSFLVRGVIRRWSQLLGDAAVCYLTAVDFGRQLRDARNDGRLSDFRQQLSELQLLVIEDVDRLADSLFVQRELRDTLDVLKEAGSLTVLTARRSPATLANLEIGLRDRLSEGLTIRLCPPGTEARENLIQLAAQNRDSHLDTNQLQTLAHNVEGSAPQLMRALVEYELGSSNHDCSRRPVELKQIVALVARYFSLTQAALRSQARRKSLVYARGITVYLARMLTDLSYAQIGQALGGRDHTTVMNSQQNIEKLVAKDPETQQNIEELRRILTAI